MTNGKKDWSGSCQTTDMAGQKKFLNFVSELKGAIVKAIADSGLSRGQVAGVVSEITGRDVSVSGLDNLCSTGKSERIPHCDIVIGICLATNSIQPFVIQAKYLPHTRVIQDIDALKLELFESQFKVKEELKRQQVLKKKLGMQEDNTPEVIQ